LKARSSAARASRYLPGQALSKGWLAEAESNLDM
jgi:hypothetical protein